MILSDNELRKYLLKNKLVIGCDSKAIQSASIDVTLGSSFKKPVQSIDGYSKAVKLGDQIRYVDYTDTVIVEPKEFILGTTAEIIDLPNDIGAFIEGRSSVGRSGIFIQNAGWICPGFKGQITLEIFNACDVPIILEKGVGIGQIIFMQLSSPADRPYNGKYNGQVGATIPSFIERE